MPQLLDGPTAPGVGVRVAEEIASPKGKRLDVIELNGGSRRPPLFLVVGHEFGRFARTRGCRAALWRSRSARWLAPVHGQAHASRPGRMSGVS
jgi:hypothetical protein